MDASGRQRKHIIGIAFIMALAIVSIRGTAAATPAHGETLTWIVTPESASIVPLTTTAGGNAELGPKVVEGLLTYDKDLNPKPLLATAWSVSKDGLQYRFTLRHGVRWHDGQPFTSADVAFSILTLKEVHPRGRSTGRTASGSG
jgi:peptide/nickel transport system substrate-binding protein